MRTKFVLTLALTTLGATAGAYYELHQTAPALRVLSSPVGRGDIVSTVVTTGTVQAAQTIEVGAEVPGLVTELHADFDSVVHKGDVLARLDPRDLQAQVDQARADLERAKADAAGQRVLLDEARTELARVAYLTVVNVNSQSDVEDARVAADTAEAQYKSAKADARRAQSALDEAEVDLGYTVIRSPVDGIVIARKVDLGQTLVPKLDAPTLFEICGDLSNQQVLAHIDESDVGKVRVGDHSAIEVDSYKGLPFAGTVSQIRVGPVDDLGVVSYDAIIEVPNPSLKLRPGMTAMVTVETARLSNVLRVPVSAVRFTPTVKVFASLRQPPVPDPGTPWSPPPGASTSVGRVWTYAGGRLSPATVTLGVSDGANIEVLNDGLRVGTELATATVPTRR
jgi:HlyD family secretion protein